MNLPIVIAAYSRPGSLSRLLNSVNNAEYPAGRNVELIISIDYSGSDKCERIAAAFDWKYGLKRIIVQKENLGLREHLIQCGNLALF